MVFGLLGLSMFKVLRWLLDKFGKRRGQGMSVQCSLDQRPVTLAG